jgi:hypothetical protein
MRPLLQSRTPTQLVWISVASNALVAVGFGALFVLSLRLPQDVRTPFSQKLPWLVLLLIGLVGDILTTLALRRGIATEQWPASLLIAPRKLLEHPVFKVLSWTLIVASVAVLVFSRGQHLAGYWFFLAPQMGLNRIQFSLREQNKVPAASQLPYPTKPLQSEQWGAPPQPFSN